MSGKVRAFAHFGVKLRNDTWSWSGRTDDGTVVVLQLWKDHFDYKSRPISYSDIGDPRLPVWQDRKGNRERIENVKWAIAHCGGKFRVVIGIAKDTDVDARETDEAYPQQKLTMRIVEFNESTGEIRAEQY